MLNKRAADDADGTGERGLRIPFRASWFQSFSTLRVCAGLKLAPHAGQGISVNSHLDSQRVYWKYSALRPCSDNDTNRDAA